MSTFSKKHRREDLTMVRRVTRDAHLRHRLNLRAWVWGAFLFLLLSVALSAIAFVGRPPHAPVVQLKQRPKFSYEAPFDFSYESRSRLENRRNAARIGVLPTFRVNTDALDAKIARYKEFARELAAAYDLLAALPEPDCQKRIADMPSALALGGSVRGLAAAATRVVRTAGSGAYLELFFNDALQQYEDFARNGLYDETTFGGAAGGDSAVRLLRSNTRNRERHVLDALIKFNNDLRYQAGVDAQPGSANQEMARNLARAMFDLMQPAFSPNIEADVAGTERAREAAVAAVAPEFEVVKAGTLLIERDVEVGPGTLERWRAFREALAKRDEKMDFGLSRTLLQNLGVGMAIMAVIALFNRVTSFQESKRKRSLTLACMAVVINLIALRLGLEFSESALVGRLGGEAITWGGAFVFASLITAVLAELPVALMSMFLVAGFASAMHGNSLEILLAVILASLVAISIVRQARQRRRIITAGLASSVPVALIAYYQVSGGAPTAEAGRSMLAALLSGLLSGGVVAALLPLAERVFKTTTNITLLELSDYNHPLLRKLQLLAPGTFHHSVMVSNIAERAAEDIRANATYCRCAALYHDIGKMAKPEYFIENQRQGANPHADIAPSMSALVIKSHVREGVEIAREYRLPRMVIDVIEQHHGTGLISYFFHKARKNCAESGQRGLPGMDSSPLPPPDDRGVDESLYRYDGPKPRTREGAIILLADSVEAASRSLRKVTPQTVEELVDAIVSDRIADGQLDDCPLTFKDIQKLRTSLTRSLITSLHQRVEYPVESPTPSKASRAPFAAKPE